MKKIYSKLEGIGDLKTSLDLIVSGSKVRWRDEKRRYTCTARSENFIIVAKPFNLRKNYDGSPICQYSILDLTQMKCNRDNLVFGLYDYLNKDDCEQALLALENSLLDIDDMKEVVIESIDSETMKPKTYRDKPTLEISQRGIADISNVVYEIYI